MANIKITDLTAYTDAASTDVLPIVDVGADVTKKITIGNVVKAVPLGTAALPGLAFDGDPNSGVYSPGGDQVAISTGGTGRLFVDASGNVGIGTTSPNVPLQVIGGSTVTDPVIRATNSGATQSMALTSAGLRMDGGAPIQIHQGGSEVARIDTSGRVGIGTASPSYELDIQAAGNSRIKVKNTSVTGESQFHHDGNGDLNIINTVSGRHLKFFNTGSERARIDSSGRLLVGTSSARANFENSTVTTRAQVEGTGTTTSSLGLISNSGTSGGNGPFLYFARSKGDAVGSNDLVSVDDHLGGISFQGNDGSEFVQGATIRAEVDGTPGANDMPGRLVFSTTADGASSPTERMRITNQGATWTYSQETSLVIGTNYESSGSNVGIIFRSGSTAVNTGTSKFIVYSNGDTKNATGVFTTISSDVRLKQDIVDVGSQWSDIKNIRLKKFRYKSDPNGELQLGVIAQELQQVCPGLVTTRIATEEDVSASGGLVAEGDEVLGWKMSILHLKAVKALQEAMERIEVLEAKVNALEGN